MKCIKIVLCALYLSLVSVGCAHQYRSVQKETLSFLSSAEKNSALQTLHGVAKVQIENKLGNYIISQKIWYKHPGNIRLETIGIFGLPLIHTLINDKTVSIFIPVKNMLLKGEISELGDAFTLKDIVTELFQGTVPAIGEGYQDLLLKESSRAYLITWSEHHLVHKVWVNKRSNTVTKYDIYSKKNNVLLKRVERSSFFRDKKNYFPRLIAIYDKESAQKVTIRFVNLNVNEVLSDDIFTLPLPAQYEERDVREFLQGLP